MSTLAIVLLILAALLLGLAIGGAIARRRQLAATQDRFDADLAAVNRDLAAARADDRGWDPARLEAAARAAWAQQSGGSEPERLELWRVVDRPGTDSDEAVYRIVSGGSETLITLGRRGDDWFAQG
jgi:hypothetical protein